MDQIIAKGKLSWCHDSVLTRWSAWLLMAITPALCTLVLIEQMRVSLANFTPATSDEVGYYLQINAFVHHGFSGGYFTISEHPAPARFSHFGVHGPMFPVLYGTLGKLFGWHFYSGPLFNVILVTLALGIYCLFLQPTVWQALLGAAFLATFWPFYMMLVSAMQDPVHWAIAILISAGFAGMLRMLPWTRTWLFRSCFLGILVYASLMRISWAMFLVPYAMLLVRKPTLGRFALAAFIALIGMGVLVYGFRLLCAPFTGAPGAFLMNKIAGGEVSAQTVFEHARHNLAELFFGELWKVTPVPGKVVYLEAFGFGCMAGLYAVASLASLLSLHRRGYPGSAALECWFYAFSIWGLFTGIILFYLIYNDGGWRMLAVHLLLCGLIALTSRAAWLRAMVVGLVLLSAGTIPWSTPPILKYNLPRFAFAHAVRCQAASMNQLFRYQEGADPWRNTVLTDRYPIEFLGLPPGIGVSFYFGKPEDLMFPIKSRYMLAEERSLQDETSHPNLAQCLSGSVESTAFEGRQKRERLARFSVLHDGIWLGEEFAANLYLH
jgi:hypothetical protein